RGNVVALPSVGPDRRCDARPTTASGLTVTHAHAPRAIARRLALAAALLALAYALMAGLITALQDRLLYHPAPAPVSGVAVDVLVAWPSPAEFRGLVAQPAGVLET